MELVIETYADGSRMVVVDSRRYYVREYQAISLGTIGDTMERVPVRAFCYSCEEEEHAKRED